MSRKTEASYNGVLREVVEHLSPQSVGNVSIVMTDYEAALMNGAQAAWPNATVVGCFFHFAQVRLEWNIPFCTMLYKPDHLVYVLVNICISEYLFVCYL